MKRNKFRSTMKRNKFRSTKKTRMKTKLSFSSAFSSLFQRSTQLQSLLIASTRPAFLTDLLVGTLPIGCLCLMIETLKALAASITSSGRLVKASKGLIACGLGAADLSSSESESPESSPAPLLLLPDFGESSSPQSGPLVIWTFNVVAIVVARLLGQ